MASGSGTIVGCCLAIFAAASILSISSFVFFV